MEEREDKRKETKKKEGKREEEMELSVLQK